MAAASMVIAAQPERVFAVLADGWSYASWVVGASHIRADAATRVTLSYDLTAGVGRFVPKPVQAALLRPRSTEMLQRLSDIAERRSIAGARAAG